MKVIIYFLISLTITLTIFLMLPSLASADTIIFKDGMRVGDIGRTWKEDGQVKWATSGITIGYPEEDVERVEKTPIKEDPILTISKTQFIVATLSHVYFIDRGADTIIAKTVQKI